MIIARLAADPARCEHQETEDLGVGGGARYLRCADCGSVLIGSRGSFWRLAPKPPN